MHAVPSTAPRRLLGPAAVLGCAATLAGCGGVDRLPSVSNLPLVPGARIVASTRSCDPGANRYCAYQLVVGAAGYASSRDLLKQESRRLHAGGWTSANADNGAESAADSPGHRLRVTFATADGDLLGIDQGWIKRSRQVTLSLSRALFAHTPTLSILLELGAS